MAYNIDITQEEFVKLYSAVFGFFCTRLSNRQDAEDLASSTVSDYLLYDKPVKNTHALLWTIARNKLYRHIRQKKNVCLTTFDESVQNISNLQTNNSEMQCFYDEVLNYAKKELSKIDFEVLELSLLCELSSQRVSEELGISAVSVRQKLSRALKKLKGSLSIHFPNYINRNL